MNITEIESELRKIEALVARWSEQGYVPQIEKNIALQRVQKFYELFLELDTQPQLESRASAHTHTIITPDPAAQSEPQVNTEQQKTDSRSDSRSEHLDVVEYIEVERHVVEPPTEPVHQVEPRFSIFGVEISKEQKERFTHDLFCNDPLVFHNEIVKLERLNSLDDVLIYIGEKYAWTPDNRSADEFVEIISRKF